MVSDIHFEPFWDPGKASQLAAVPAAQWNAILAAPATPDQQQRFAAMQKGCHAKGVDTSYPLLDTSLRTMRARAAGAKFITLSGDLISHGFSCKFNSVFPHAAPADYRAFVEKTIDYVLLELRGTFPGVPLYAALGNNDSGCGDYQLDAHSDFLSAEGQSFTSGFPASERSRAQETFAAGGYYSVSLPGPFQHARLLVLDDLFMSSRYQTCGGKPDPYCGRRANRLAARPVGHGPPRQRKGLGHVPHSTGCRPLLNGGQADRRMRRQAGGYVPLVRRAGVDAGRVWRCSPACHLRAYAHGLKLRLLTTVQRRPGFACAKTRCSEDGLLHLACRRQ